jgi:cold-inducible RNA-binding protein
LSWSIFHSSPRAKDRFIVKIFVGNLPFSMDNDQLAELFKAHGEVDSASVVTDRDTGRSRGFGFVEMADDTAARKAIEAINGQDVGGRALTVNEARPQARRDGGGGGRGGDRGGRRERY